MTPRSPRPFWPIALLLVGAVPGLTAHFLYKIGLLATAEIGMVRTLGLLGALGGLGAGLALLAAWALWAARAGEAPPLLQRLGRTAIFAGWIANLASVGLALHYWSPNLAPAPIKWGALAGCAILVLAYLRYQADEQKLILRVLTAIGLGALAVPLLATPWLVVAWTQHTHQLRGAVQPLAAPEPRPDRPRRIVMITFDALAADRTSLHNPALDNTPTLEALAGESTWFTNCRAVSDSTLVSMSTALSGLSPSTIQPQLIGRLGYVPFDAITGVAGFLKPAGYRAYYATMLIHPSVFGLANEFETGVYNARHYFSNEFHSPAFLPIAEAFRFLTASVVKTPRNAAETRFVQAPLPAVGATFREAGRMLEEASEPAFVWMHIGAPHLPYAEVRVTEDGLQAERVVSYEAARAANLAKDADKAREYQAVYDEFVRYVDLELGRFVSELKQANMWDDALVIVSSDHGETHRPGRIGHGGPYVREQTFVPLMIKRAGQQAPAREDAFVGHIDMVPTILGQVYRQLPPDLPGVPLLDRPVPTDRTLFTHDWFPEGNDERRVPRSIAAYRDHFVYAIDYVNGSEALYDIEADPEETRDVSAAHPELLARLRAEVAAERAKF